jgi:hypothetical protein
LFPHYRTASPHFNGQVRSPVHNAQPSFSLLYHAQPSFFLFYNAQPSFCLKLSFICKTGLNNGIRLRRLLAAHGDERAREVQGLLCGALQAIIVRLNPQTIAQHADTFMVMFLSVLQAKSATLNEEVASP